MLAKTRFVLDKVTNRLGERSLIALMLAGGAVMRVLYVLFINGLQPLSGDEPARIAAAIVQRGEFADAFGAGTGPTAHVGWMVVVTPTIVYSIFGVDTREAQLVLMIVSICVVCLSFYLCFTCLKALGENRSVCMAALAVLCLVPIQFSLEASELRVWEAGIAAAALAGMLRVILDFDRRSEPLASKTLVGLGAAAAALAVLNPASGLAAGGLVTVLLCRRGRAAHIPAALGGFATMYVALIFPWDIRNQHVFGASTGSRSSLGIGLSISYYDKVFDHSPQQSYVIRVTDIHPDFPRGMARLRAAGGEIAYGLQLKNEALHWMLDNPLLTARIWARNLWNFYFPSAWYWRKWSPVVGITHNLSSAVLGFLSFFGLSILITEIWRGRWLFIYPAVAVLLVAPLYVVVFPLLRYRYPISSLLVALGVVGLARITGYIRKAGMTRTESGSAETRHQNR